MNISDRLLKKIGQKFPVMNVIIGNSENGYTGVRQQREIDGYLVHLIIGISNVYIVDVEELKDEK